MINLCFDRRQYVVGDRAGVAEVKTQPLRRHQRAGLTHMLAQFFSQHGVENMGRRMVEHGFAAMLGVNFELNLVADLNAAFFDSAAMGGQLRRWMMGVDDFHHSRRARC